MIIETKAPRPPWVFRVTVILSVLFHAVAWAGLTHFGSKPIADSYLLRVISDPKLLPPTPEPPTPAPAPPPKPTPPPKMEEPLPPPNKEVKEESEEPPKAIFGVTEESVVDESDFSVRVGNTLMKAQEKEFTDPSQVHPYKARPAAVKVSAPPKLRRMVPPEYPALARKSGTEGRVVLKIQISGSGRVVSAQVVKAQPAGFGFEQAALEAVKQWEYSAPGEGQDIWFYQPVRFTLED